MKNLRIQKSIRGGIFLFLFLLAIFFNASVIAQSPYFAWVKQAGGDYVDFGSSITTDRSNHIIITGLFRDTANFDGNLLTSLGSFDIFVAIYDTLGNLGWLEREGGPDLEHGISITTDGSDNIFFTGHFWYSPIIAGTQLNTQNTLFDTAPDSEDIFIAKYYPIGFAGWQADGSCHAGWDASEFVYDIATDGDNNILITGGFGDSTRFHNCDFTNPQTLFSNSEYNDIFIAKYNEKREIMWAKKAGGTDKDWGEAICTDGSNNCIITGSFSGTAYFDGESVISKGQEDIFIAKYSPAGQLMWITTAGGDSNDYVYDIALDGLGNIIITGSFRGTATFGLNTFTSFGNSDIFVAKYDNDGTGLWAKQAGGDSSDYGRSIATDESGNIIVAATSNGDVSFDDQFIPGSFRNSDIFIAKYKPTGEVVWVKQVSRDYHEIDEVDIATYGANNIYITGSFKEANFDSIYVSAGADDIFLAKLIDTFDMPVISAQKVQKTFVLKQNYPNPFNTETEIVYQLSKDKYITLSIYNLLGNKIQTLISCKQRAGRYAVNWDGRDQAGQPVASGMYLYRIVAGNYHATKKCLLLK